MQFMVLFSLNPDKAQTAPAEELREAEFEAVRGFYMEGLMRQVWLRSDGSGAFAIVESDSADTATEKLGSLPMVRAGVLEAPVIVPMSPYWGFAPRSK
jgi:muconolactone delta-isomerase